MVHCVLESNGFDVFLEWNEHGKPKTKYITDNILFIYLLLLLFFLIETKIKPNEKRKKQT